MLRTPCTPKTVWGLSTVLSSDCSEFAECVKLHESNKNDTDTHFCACGYSLAMLQDSADTLGSCELSTASVCALGIWLGMAAASLVVCFKVSLLFRQSIRHKLFPKRSDPMFLLGWATITATLLLAVKCCIYGLRMHTSFSETARSRLDDALAVVGGLLTGAYVNNLVLYGVSTLLVLVNSARMVVLTPERTGRLERVILSLGVVFGTVALILVLVLMLARLYTTMYGLLAVFALAVFVLYVLLVTRLGSMVAKRAHLAKFLRSAQLVSKAILLISGLFLVGSSCCFVAGVVGTQESSKALLGPTTFVFLALQYFCLLVFQIVMFFVSRVYVANRMHKLEHIEELKQVASMVERHPQAEVRTNAVNETTQQSQPPTVANHQTVASDPITENLDAESDNPRHVVALDTEDIVVRAMTDVNGAEGSAVDSHVAAPTTLRDQDCESGVHVAATD